MQQAANVAAVMAAVAAAVSSSSPLGSAAAAAAASSSSRAYRILHLTDIHFTIRPTWRECWSEPKRLLGLLNHSLLGRGAHFSRQVQQQLVGEVRRQQPTHVVISGDLTSFASDAEFELAYETLKPILRPAATPVLDHATSHVQPSFSSTSTPADHADATTEPAASHRPPSTATPATPGSADSWRTVLVSGNHDVYTFSSVRARLMDRWFGHWRLPTARVLTAAPDLHFVAIDACQPNYISSHGHVQQQQLSLLRASLSSLRSGFVVLVSHYPLLDRDGSDYFSRHRWHGIDNNSQVCEAVRESMHALMIDENHTGQPQSHSSAPSSRQEDEAEPGVGDAARVGTGALLLHGHVHRGYTVPFPLQTQPFASHSSLQRAVGSHSTLASATSSVGAFGPTPPPPTSFPVYNPGSAGRSFSPNKRAAAYNVYTITRDDQHSTSTAGRKEASASASDVHVMNGWRLAVERFVHNGSTFESEQQGPYTTAT